MNIYTLFAIDEESSSRHLWLSGSDAGEWGHAIIGVYKTLADARKVADQVKRDHDALLIVSSALGAKSFSSQEVWRWSIGWED